MFGTFLDEWIDDILSDGESDSSNIESNILSLPMSNKCEEDEPQPETSKMFEVIKKLWKISSCKRFKKFNSYTFDLVLLLLEEKKSNS